MSSTGSGWSQLRQQVRALESQVSLSYLFTEQVTKSISGFFECQFKLTIPSQTDSLFHTYSQYAASSHLPPKPSEEEQKTEKQILELLEKVNLSHSMISNAWTHLNAHQSFLTIE